MLSVFFYLPKQFSSGSNARWPFLKYKMIISRRSMRIFNANCEVLINVPSLCSPKGFISLSIHFPYYVRIPDFLFFQISSPSTNLFPPPSSVYSSFTVPAFFPTALFVSLSFLLPLHRSHRRGSLFQIQSRWGGCAEQRCWSFLRSHTYSNFSHLIDLTCKEKS